MAENAHSHPGTPRRETRRLVAGRGTFTGDIVLPRMAHVAFLRSPHAHARIALIDAAAARAMPGVLLVATAAELAGVCQPMQTAMVNAPDHVSPPKRRLRPKTPSKRSMSNGRSCRP